MLEFVKSFLDPVYGTVPLTETEYQVTRTPVFQRLRRVGQLTLAADVYSGGNYTRLSHSIGACHVAGQLMDALIRNGNVALDDKEVQHYRLAALLHDIGHYPFSHPMERSLKDALDRSNLVQGTDEDEDSQENEPPNGIMKHEDVGKWILEHDPELSEVLERAGYTPQSLSNTFQHTGGGLANLVSSDLDADRLDYLRRNSHHTGLPYGFVDADYLITQIHQRGDESPYIPTKAVVAADHFLVGRILDYQQLAWHKTIAGLEHILVDVLSFLIDQKRIPGWRHEIEDLVDSGRWISYDDAFVYERMRIALAPDDSSTDELIRDKIIGILDRKPPKILAESQWYGELNDTRFRERLEEVERYRPQLASDAGLEETRFFIWTRPGITLTSIGPYAAVPASEYEYLENASLQRKLIHVRSTSRNGSTEPITTSQRSLMSILSKYALFSIRVYAVLPPNADVTLRQHLRQSLLNRFGWLE